MMQMQMAQIAERLTVLQKTVDDVLEGQDIGVIDLAYGILLIIDDNGMVVGFI